MWLGVISLFPEMFHAMQFGITGKAIKNRLVELSIWNPRDFTLDRHKSVDDYPYGGGAGMVMMAEPLRAAILAAKQKAPSKPTVIYLSPQGVKFDQSLAAELSQKESLLLLAGRYEGIDERIIMQEVDQEISIGDYILTGGELAAMVMMDSMIRLLPGVVGEADSVTQDSLTTGLLKYPQYTRPEVFNDVSVPEVLLSGHHREIEKWRIKASLGKTWLRRPDLMAKKNLNKEETALLTEFIEEFNKSV